MTGLKEALGAEESDTRRAHIVETLAEAFSELMAARPKAFRSKFRKMAADPFAFYRGSACLFYADIARLEDPWADERTGRVWIQGDLHAENFGTYMNGSGILVFDVNDFDESYVGHFTWDLQRFAASIALLGWRKALSDNDIAAIIRCAGRAYLDQVDRFVAGDTEFSLSLDTTTGTLHDLLHESRLRSRITLLERMTETEDYDRRFRDGPNTRRLPAEERAAVLAAFTRYLDTIPQQKRMIDTAYRVKDIVGASGFGIGSAGLSAYNVLIEGPNQALENDIVLSMKQGTVAAPSRVVTDERIRGYFQHHGHRTALSQRALQAHADPLLGYTEMEGVGYVIDEISPYECDLDWNDLTEPEDILPVIDCLGRATAKVHCVSDSDSDHQLVPFQTEEAIAAVTRDHVEEFLAWLVEFGVGYAGVVRDDHKLFVDAFRDGEIPGVRSTAAS